MKRLITITLLVISSVSFSQNGNSLWKLSTLKKDSKEILKKELTLKHLFDLDVNSLKTKLASSPKRDAKTSSKTIISLPNGDGNLENFIVYENSVMDPVLAEKYPEIKSYVAIGIDNPSARAYFSNSPLGFKSMILYADEAAVFIEPISADLKTYTAYKKSEKEASLDSFECSTIDQVNNTQKTNKSTVVSRYAADDGKLRTFRLAFSCTAEYASYFGGTKSLALAGMNNTLTRVNAIFERDFGVKLILISNNDTIIYTNALTDPYSDYTSKSNWRSELKTNLNSQIGLANYDIGHLLGAAPIGGGGDAGCIGCVCSDFNKGAGYTCAIPTNYSGDSFDIEYVAHEMGHQLGANHTFTCNNEGTLAQLEPGSGSTIMSYAGVTSKDIQKNCDSYFHAISIQQVTDIIKTKTCAILISTGNAVPVINAGLDYTIPKGTPFLLTGSATDANTDDLLTYSWEEMDLGTSATTVPNSTATTGPLFRSYSPSFSAIRHFPNMTTILSGLTATSGLEIPVEVLSDVSRTLNFRLTVRDNRAGGSANNTDDMVVNVDGNSGPFKVDSQNSIVTYTVGTTQTINWSVAGTNSNGVNCAGVDILLSTDGGKTFAITLLSETPNNGSANITIPNIPGNQNRIMVKGTNQIFFDINNVNFIISALSATDTIVPTTSILSASGTNSSDTNLSWTPATDNTGVTGYNVYQNGVLKTTTTTTSLFVSGLSSSTNYSFYIIAKDAVGNLSTASNSITITTLTPADITPPTTSTLSASGTTTSDTNLSWTPATDNIGVTGYNVYQNGVLKTTTTTTSLFVSGLSASTNYSFYVIAKDASGNLSASSNIINIVTLVNTTLDKFNLAYCTSSGIYTDKEYINKVEIGSIVNTSGNNNGYKNFVTMSTDLALGSTNTIVITPTWIRSSFAESYNVWIDFNQDGDFEDSGELIFSKSKTKAKFVSGSLFIPTSASIGTTRMRVSMKNNILPNSCEIFTYGEVEDYTVNITGTTAKPENYTIEASVSVADNFSENPNSTLKLYPNPVKGNLITISNSENYTDFIIFNLIGQELGRNHLENNEIYLDYLKKGVYLIQFTNNASKITKQFIKE
ncbi:reprolysin-like metallopeptidase [Flavobacterium sp.]|uniref:reprolysin-like metallopeptidase n=1 Tax=Flavobacterium sp. TaxID=239 RepID=UPI0038FD1F0F